MKKYDFNKMSNAEIETAIIKLRAETEAIKKAGEVRHQKNLDEIDAIKKAGEARHQKYLAEIGNIAKRTRSG